MSDANKIVEIFKYYPSDTLKAEQTKLTKTANSIRRDAVDSRLKVLFSPEEIDVLKQAAQILHGLKAKVTHAKEIKQREERKQKAHRAQCEVSQKALVRSLFPETDTPDDNLYVVGLWLALSANYADIFGRRYCYIPEHRYLVNTLERAVNADHHFTIQRVVSDCRDNLEKLLMGHLWSSDDPGNIDDIQKIRDLYQTKWQYQRSDEHLNFLSKVSSELAANAFVDGIKLTAGSQ